MKTKLNRGQVTYKNIYVDGCFHIYDLGCVLTMRLSKNPKLPNNIRVGNFILFNDIYYKIVNSKLNVCQIVYPKSGKVVVFVEKGEYVTNEKWVSVKGYEGIYEISDRGNVRSILFDKERILRHGYTKFGYPQVGLIKDGVHKSWRVHQLAAMSFLDHTPCGLKLVVNHIDHNPKNNRLDNLEIVTQKYNVQHGHRFRKIAKTLI